MRNRMWFGTQGQETWVPSPAIDPAYSRGGFMANTPNLEGGTTIDASKNARNLYALTWNKGARDDLRPIMDFADGVYDTKPGVNLIYWVDPVAADRNVLPQHWATPALGTEDGPSLLLDNPPAATATGANTWRLPARSARYTQQTGDATATLYLPIPPGYVLWAGVIGDSGSNNRVLVRDVYGTTATATTHPLARLTGSDGVLTNLSLPRVEGSRTGVQFELVTGSATTFVLTAMTALLLPAGVSPRAKVPWSSGQGHSGCQFSVRPSMAPHSVKRDLVALQATLEETGAYL